MSANKSRIDPDVDGDAPIFYDDADDDAGWRDDDGDTDSRRRRTSPAGWWQRRHWLVFAAAFMIPFGVLALGLVAVSHFDDGGGTSTATVVVAPTPSAAVVGQWPADVNFVANTVPAMIRDDIAFVGAQRGYLFEGRAGETWRITVDPEGDFDPEIRLYEPEGSELAYNDDLAAGSMAAEMVVMLPADGTYRLLVEAVAKGNGLTGTYWLTVFEE
jgi:hypothetical protein